MPAMNKAIDNITDLTQSQLWIWTGQQLSPDLPLYNVVFTFELAGEIDVARFRTAFQSLIDQCESMRTVFESTDDIPKAKLLDSVSYQVEFLDFSKEKDPTEHFQSWLDERMKRNFDECGRNILSNRGPGLANQRGSVNVCRKKRPAGKNSRLSN